MRRITRKGLALLAAIAMVFTLIPAAVFADDGGGSTINEDGKVLKKVECNISGVDVTLNNTDFTVKFKVPFGFSDTVKYSNCNFVYNAGYGAVTPASDDFSLGKGQNTDVVFEYGEAGGTTYTSTYNFSVEEKEFKAPVFNAGSAISVTGNVGTAGIEIPASVFNAKYTANDGGPISRVVFTSATNNSGIELRLNGQEITGPISFTDIQNGKLKAFASEAVSSVPFRFDVYYKNGGDHVLVGENAILNVTANLNTSLEDVTGNTDQRTNYLMSGLLDSVQSKAGATTLTKIKFKTLPSATYGILYTDSGRSVAVKDTDEFTWANGKRVVFYSGTTAGIATIGYEAWDDLNIKYTGAMRITVAASVADTDVKFTVNQDETLKFTKTGFNTASNNAGASTLDYIVFDSVPNSSQGALYYNYKNSSNPGTKITAGSTKYYYTTGTKLITDITFVPKNSYSGTVSLNYKGTGNSGKTFSGKINIEVKAVGGDIATISLTVAKGSKVTFTPATFNTNFKKASGETLNYVKFELPASSNGILYYDYKSTTDTGTKVTSSTQYYYNPTGSQKALGKVTFVPKSTYVGSFYIDYTGYDSYEDEYKGRVKITVSSDSGEDTDADIELISYTIAQDRTQALSSTTINTKFKDASDGETLYYATFKQPKNGALYYDYKSASDTGTKVSESTKYYRIASGTRKLINNITYVPAAGYNGTVYIDYIGYDEYDDDYTGQIKIKVGTGIDGGDKIANLTYSIKSNEMVGSFATAINNAFKKVDGDNLEYVKFTLPPSSIGNLYATYNSSAKTGTPASSSAKYYRIGNPSLNSVVFVPNASYTGTYDLKYKAFNENEDSYDGIIKITVTKGDVSIYFTDITSGYSWAATEIDSLYARGVVKGVAAKTYGPASNIKRGDFMLMLYRAFNLKSSVTTSDFKDVPKNSYYYDAIKIGKALGIAQGSDGKFSPESNLTRQDAMALVYRTIEKAGKKLPQGTSADMTQFSDRSLVSSYAYTAVATLVKANIIKGTADASGKYRINPNAQMTRAEMAVVLYRILELQ